MSPAELLTSREFYAQTYDLSVADWPGELDFYLRLAGEAEGGVLELAVGTGRIALRLARAGLDVTGIDRSPEMLAIARANSADVANLHLIEADMRSFDVGRRFGLVIIPAHSFQNLLTTDDQLACLRRVRDHLLPEGRLVVHLDDQDLDWLGAISPGGNLNGVFEPAETFVDPDTGQTVRASRAWTYRRSDQTAFVTTRWEGLAEHGPTPIHCVFRYEMEHALAAAGYVSEVLFGDFDRGPLTDTSSEMIFVACRRNR